MAQLQKPAAALLFITAAAIVFLFVVGPLMEDLFEDSFDATTYWLIVDPMVFVSSVIALTYTWRAKSADAADGQTGVTRDWLAHRVAFYAVGFFFILWMSNYMLETIIGADVEGTYRNLVWIIIDAGLPLAFLAVGRMLWRESN